MKRNARQRDIYLPQGHWWCDYHSKIWYEGGQQITVDAPLERIPLFVMNGGMIPTGKVMRYTGEQTDDFRQLECFVHPTQAANSTFILYEDDGLTLDYQNGYYRQVTITIKSDHSSIYITTSSQGNYKPEYNSMVLKILDDEVRQVFVNQQPRADITSILLPA